jgi:hypothetical protein
LGDYVVVDTSLEFLTKHFPHLTKNQMLLLGKDHVIDFIPGAQKEVYCSLLCNHLVLLIFYSMGSKIYKITRIFDEVEDMKNRGLLIGLKRMG